MKTMFDRSCLRSRRRLIAATAAVALLPVRVAAGPRTESEAAGEAPWPEPLLATVYAGQVDPALCLVSEKYDGVRALWDGRALRFRSGRPIAAPGAFLRALPEEPIDGELWLGRGRFEALSAIVRTTTPRDADWARVRYMAFELPIGTGTFAARAAALARLAERLPPGPLVAAPQERVGDRAALMRRLAAVVADGGEGLMLHVASAPVASGRGGELMKLKPHLDAEAVVVGMRPGAGRHRGAVGALEVEAADGRRFFVGSGLSDALRRDPPPPGSVITYRYRDLTSTGLPRFPTYLRRHESL